MTPEQQQANVQAVMKDGVQYIPLATIVEQLGGTIKWDNEAKMATMNVRGRNAEVDINDRIIRVDGSEQILSGTPFVEAGRLYVTPDFLDQIGISHT